MLFLIGEDTNASNLNFLLEQYGINAKSDKVVSAAFNGKLMHPRECLITDGITNRDLSKHVRKYVYPHGCTLTTQRPAVAVLSTGANVYPYSCVTAAVHETESGGRIAVLGSKAAFSDKYLNMEDNTALLDWVIGYLAHEKDCTINKLDAATSSTTEQRRVANTGALAVKPKVAPHALDSLPGNYVALIHNNLKLYGGRTDLMPEVSKLYEALDLPRGDIRLIPPQFEAPIPDLEPAVHPPVIIEPYEPKLDLFDLDEELADEDTRLARVVGRGGDIDSAITAMGEIVGISRHLNPADRTKPNAILHKLLTAVVQFKMFDQGDGAAPAPEADHTVESFGNNVNVMRVD